MRGWSVQSLAEATECLRVAEKICPPRLPFVLLALANTRCIRYIETDSNEDSGKATALLETILDPNQPQIAHLPEPEYTEMAILRRRSELRSTSIDEEFRLLFTESLAVKTRERFTQYSLAESLEDANSYTSQVIESTFHPPKAWLHLGNFFLLGSVWESLSLTRIVEEIQYLERLLSITPDSSRDRTS
ncbi:hypothetical protein EI94DRAFT_138665 [Lactarius quietus]|nr:hypothetical protein EI94DRAFT_138665 [Lactarius quietus]